MRIEFEAKDAERKAALLRRAAVCLQLLAQYSSTCPLQPAVLAELVWELEVLAGVLEVSAIPVEPDETSWFVLDKKLRDGLNDR